MSNQIRMPWYVPLLTSIMRPLLGAGIPMGPNALVTIRGRKSGLPRTLPLTIVEYSGRRWLLAPFGEVNWVRNLRAAGEATISQRGKQAEVTAVELGPEERVTFFRDILAPLARSMPIAAWIVRNVDHIDFDHPEAAAQGRFVFELYAR
jgi:deazaflavin-dependent oxidoreductase (nitroreductase family)